MDEIIKVTRVYGRGRTQIPIEIIKALQLKDGDKIVWFLSDSGVYYIKKSATQSNELKGKYRIVTQ